METTYQRGALKRDKSSLNNVLLLCGIIAAVLYISADVIAAFRWDDYSMAAQAFSELIATDAPTRPFMVPLLVVYSLLFYAFGIGVISKARGLRALKLAGIFLITKEILGVVVTLFFPIHLRGVETNYQDTMHGILTAVGVLSLLLAIGFGSGADGKWFRYYSFLTILLMAVFGIWAGADAPNIEANLPTPLFGLKERVNIYAYMLWMTVLAIILIRKGRSEAVQG